jgi:hypothetical protein
MRRLSLLRVAALAAVFASVLSPGTVGAATSNHSYSVSNVWGTMGVWGDYATFYARWNSRFAYTSNGVKYAVIDGLELSGQLPHGLNCTSDICAAWSFSVKAEVLTNKGVVIGTFTNTQFPATTCYDAIYGPTARHWARCKATTTINDPDPRLRLTWTISVQRRDGFWVNAWTKTQSYFVV